MNNFILKKCLNIYCSVLRSNSNLLIKTTSNGQCHKDVCTGSKMKSVDFEVFGRVQGVFFRRDTRETAQKLNLKGWVKNTRHSTVVGTVQGEKSAVDEMKHWLSHIGSKSSKIEKCNFSNEKDISAFEFSDFSVRY
ncbi:acylphosphatase-2-like isoform X2 [Centruroides vittatus]|uniref:acylphosphatase-2-like isoform X2 n=1 Tax=Centruroides vittatus TaxID=120091 RepID=UPI00350F38F7